MNAQNGASSLAGFTTGLSKRQLTPEWMDRPNLDATLHRQALAGLARLNACSRSTTILWQAMRRFIPLRRPQTLSILDVGSGAGDVAIGLWRRATRLGLSLDVVGYDLSPAAVMEARQRAARARAEVSFRQCDFFKSVESRAFDIVVCSLFMHHHDQPRAIQLLQGMGRAARRVVLVNDLERSLLSHWIVSIGARLLSRSPIVHNDGATSVAAAFTLPEARALAAQAGWQGARISRHFPCRFLLSWSKPA